MRAAAVTPVTAAFFRAAYAVPVLAGWWWVRRHRDHRPPWARALAVAAGILLAIDLVAWHVSIASVGAGLATLLANAQVVFVALLGWLLLDERPSATALLALPVVLAGVALVTGVGRPDAYGERPLLGAVTGVVAAFFYAAFILTWRASNRALAPTVGPLLDATVGAGLGALAAGLLFPLRLTWSWPSHGWLMLLALVAQVLAWQLIGYALPRLPGLQTSFVILLQPVMTFLWGALLFEERLSALQAIGVVLVLGGIGAVAWRGAAQATRSGVSYGSP